MKQDAQSFILVIRCSQARDLGKQTAKEKANKAKQYEAFDMRHSKFVRMIHIY